MGMKYHPQIEDRETRAFFEACPKAVLWEIARQFGMRVADNFSDEAALRAIRFEWSVLHDQGLVATPIPAKWRIASAA